MLWAVQTNLISWDRQVKPIVDALRKHHIPHEDVAVVPFEDLLFQIPTAPASEIAPYGSVSLVRRALKLGWAHTFFDPQTFCVSAWLEHRGQDMLNADAVVFSIEEARVFLGGQHPSSRWFMRPNEDLKVFPGTVSSAAALLDKLFDPGVGTNHVPIDSDVVISKMKPYYDESRHFIVNRKVVSSSIYKLEGNRLHSEKIPVLPEVEEMAAGWLPHETCVMDLAHTNDGFKIIEFNCLNCSGFYANDVEAIFLAATAYAKDRERCLRGPQ